MPELLKPPPQLQSHAQNLRAEASRRLSRSPHPYHRQKFEIPHASEKFTVPSKNVWRTQSPLRPAYNTDDEGQQGPRLENDRYRTSASDSGTEADDEHFLKGLPAPKLRPHKGLRGHDGSLSNSPSPMLSPAIWDEDALKSPFFLRRTTLPTLGLSDEETRKAAEKFRKKRKVELVRRSTETALLALVGVVICLDSKVRLILRICSGELAVQSLVTVSLLAVYPVRLLRHVNLLKPVKKPYPIAIPAAFDPAPILYPPIITLLVSLCLSYDSAVSLLPSIILGIASLPRHLIPSTGGIHGSNTIQWFLSCLPLLFAQYMSRPIELYHPKNPSLTPEILALVPPLHQTLRDTLHYLTTTSLLEAELQLLSIALIHLIFLASSPQTVILKSLLWGGGVGVLVTCGNVLKWGVALARVPKWRFRGSRGATKRNPFSLRKLREALFAKVTAATESSDDDDQAASERSRQRLPKLNTRENCSGVEGNGSVSAVEPKGREKFSGRPSKNDFELSFSTQRRHTLASLTQLPQKPSKRTSSGRRRKAIPFSAQPFFALTPSQATFRKWIYAGYVYICIMTIILLGIRQYVARFALFGNEPVGWALGYLFGDIPRFRMTVITTNLQHWVCLPSRSGLEKEESCHLGWVEHLRHASFGEANTRLILCGYWIGIIITGLAVVLRLSAVYEVDTRRKVFHFMMVAMLLPATFVDPTFAALALSLMLAIFLMLDLFRASQLPPLSKSLAYFLTPYVDGRDLKGPVVISHIFLLIGCAIPLWLSLGALPRTGENYARGWEVPTREVSMVSGVICVGLGDAAASLIGRRYGRRKWLWGGGKSIEGSIAFATAVGAALVMAKAWLRIGEWPANNNDSWVQTIGKSGVAAGMASLTEAVLTGGNDNVIVPVVLWLCVKGLDI